jgi:hypothetical protein
MVALFSAVNVTAWLQTYVWKNVILGSVLEN